MMLKNENKRIEVERDERRQAKLDDREKAHAHTTHPRMMVKTTKRRHEG